MNFSICHFCGWNCVPKCSCIEVINFLWWYLDRRLLAVTRFRWSDNNGVFPVGLISFCDTRENFLRFFSSFVPPSFSSFSYEGSFKKQLKCNSKHRSPMRICHSSILMLGFEPPKLLVQVSLYYFAIAALLVDSHIYVCMYNIKAQSLLNYTGADVYT